MVVAGELGELLDDHALGRHVDADGQRLGGEHHLDEAFDEARLDHLLERRDHAGVMGGDPGFELGEELAVAEHGEIGGFNSDQASVDDLPDPVAIITRGEPHPGGEHRPRRLVALVATEDEVDGRQHLLPVEHVHDVEPRRGVQPPTTLGLLALTPATATTTGRLAIEPDRVVVGPPVHQHGQQVEPIVGLVTHVVEVLQSNRPAILDHRRHRAANRGDPIGELLRVADGCRQANQGDRLREVDDHLLPHRTAVGVLQEVHLVEHHHVEQVERRALGVDHVAQHLGGHHHHRRITVDRVVTREETNLFGAVACRQVVILLIRQCLDRRRVEGAPAGEPGSFDGVFGHHGLAASSGRGNEHGLPVVERVERPELEPVEREGVVARQL